MTYGSIPTKRLSLDWPDHPLIDADAYQTTLWLNDPEVVKYSEQRHRVHSIMHQLEHVASYQWPNQYRLIRLDGQLIGTITANVDSYNSVANVGIMIGDKSEWGKGYGTEAWLGLMHHLFGMGVRKIEAGCMSHNLGMVGIFRKSGMTPEGVRQCHFLLDGQPVDLKQWARFNNG